MQKSLIALALKPITFGIIVVLALATLAYAYYSGKEHREDPVFIQVLDSVGHQVHNLRLRFRGPVRPDSQVAILAVDEESLEKLGHWPWPRSVFAEVLQSLEAYGAKNLAFDVIFSEEDQKSAVTSLQRVRQLGRIDSTTHPELDQIINQEIARENTDEIFARAIAKRSENLVMGSYFEDIATGAEPYRELCLDALYEATPDSQYWRFQNLPIQAEGFPQPRLPQAWSDVLKDQIFPILQQEELEAWRTRSPNNEYKFQRAQEQFAKYDIADESLTQFLIQYWVDRKDQEFNTILDLALDPAPPGIFHAIQGFLPKVFERADQVSLRSAFMTRKLNYCLQSFWSEQDPAAPGFEDALPEVHQAHSELADLTVDQIQSHYKNSLQKNPITRPGRWWTNIISLARGTTYTGFFNTRLDGDGVIRRARLIVRSGSHYIPSISFLSYLAGYNYTAHLMFEPAHEAAAQGALRPVQSVEVRSSAGDLVQQIPVDRFGDVIINYAGPDRSYPYMSVSELLSPETKAKITQGVWDEASGRWRLKDEFVDKLNFIKDRHFILGATAVGLYDLRVTPFTENYPGVETHANVLSNLIEGNFLKTHAMEKEYMLIFLVAAGLLLALLISYASAVTGLVATIFALAAIVWVDYTWIFKSGYVISSFLPLLSFSSLYVALTAHKYFTEERQKKELKGTFQKYVSPAIVNEVLKDPSNLSLGGRKQVMSVFFSDVRGFTTISERLDPQELSSLLNSYLTPMTEIVFKNRGTLDKYMGDAVMAFFGAPIAYPDHAAYACRCALEQMEKLRQIQKEYRERNLPNIDIGIGINTGEMSVGNMGSKTVRSYTVMGDAVNLGSRLEGINKEYGTNIIISEYTQAALDGKFWTREIDLVKVKGKVKPVRIFELVSETDPDANVQEMLGVFQTGYTLYMKKRFSEARQSFQKGLDIVPGDPVCQLYIERCQSFLAKPPPQDWDGVYVMTTK